MAYHNPDLSNCAGIALPEKNSTRGEGSNVCGVILEFVKCNNDAGKIPESFQYP